MSNSGTVKCFHAMKNFGFITYEGGELFVHTSNCKGGMPKEGDAVTFDIEECPKKPGQNQATNVVGGTGALKGVMGSGSRQGTVKWFNGLKGWGFITSDGEDIFVHIGDCEGGMPMEGDMVAFDIVDNEAKPGTTKAGKVTGGTGDLFKGKGKGKGGDKGGDMWGMMGGYGPMWGMKGGKGGSSPYGGKGGKGWGMGGMGGMGKGGWGMGGMGGMGNMMSMGWY